MSEPKEHPYIPRLKQQLAGGRIDRRDFLRSATLLGLSAGAAYAFAGRVNGGAVVGSARAALPKGGTLRIAMRVQEVTHPHTFSWIEPSNIARQVVEFVTVTGHDNVTRPWLAERWETSDDLKTDIPPSAGCRVAQRAPFHGRGRGVESEAGARPRNRIVRRRVDEGLYARRI